MIIILLILTNKLDIYVLMLKCRKNQFKNKNKLPEHKNNLSIWKSFEYTKLWLWNYINFQNMA